MRSELLAYLAGVIDADGFFSITTKTGRPRRDDSRASYFTPRIGCSQVERLVPDLLAETFGGAVFESHLRSGRIYFMWQAYSREAVAASALLLPFLRLKRRRAELVIALGAEIRAYRGALTENEQQGRRAIYEELRALNRPAKGAA